MTGSQKIELEMVAFYKKKPKVNLGKAQILASQYVGKRPAFIECEGVRL